MIGLAKANGARLVYISTDYVFDGEDGPYSEDADVNPINAYGKHKLEAEQLVLAEVPNSLVIRITNVYGDEERGKNFIARLVTNAIKGEPMDLKLPIDQFATPVNAYDIARVIYLLLRDKKSGIYNASGSDYVNRFQLATRVASYFPSKSITLQPIRTSELGQAAPRPLKGGLINYKFISEYPDFVFSNVDDYLKARKEN